MPEAFMNCVRGGGRVRTKKLSGERFQHFCFKDGKAFAGEVKSKKKEKPSGNRFSEGLKGQ